MKHAKNKRIFTILFLPLFYSTTVASYFQTTTTSCFLCSDFKTKNTRCFMYYCPTPPTTGDGWASFHVSAFQFPQILHTASSLNVPVILLAPAEYNGTRTTDNKAPWIEGERVALSWASAFFRFKQLGNVDVRIILFCQKDILTQETIKKVITNVLHKQIQDDTTTSSESQLKQRMFQFNDVLQEKITLNNNFLVTNMPYLNSSSEDTVTIQPKLKPCPEHAQRFLITGGTGFIGSHLVKVLIKQGHQVIILDNLSTSSINNLDEIKNNENLEIHIWDASKPFDIEGPLSGIIHLASLPSPEYYYTQPYQALVTGLNTTKNTLDLAVKKNARYFFTSSSEVYGDPKVAVQSEEYPGNVNPIGKRSQYDQSKRGGETLIKLYFKKYSIDARIARIFNTYGPYMNLDDGRVIPNFIKAVLNHQPLVIYGDGKQTRSFCYIDDLIDGILKLLESEKITIMPTIEQRIFNLGNPDIYTINQLATSIISIAKKYGIRSVIMNIPLIRFLIEHIPQFDLDDPRIRKPDISKAQSILDYQPHITLEKGLEKTISFFHTRSQNDSNSSISFYSAN